MRDKGGGSVMGLTPHSFVAFETPEHTHLLVTGDGTFASDIGYEGIAEELAEAVEICSPYRHNGHGAYHTKTQVESAYLSALHQIQHTDFEEEWRLREWDKYLFEKWNGVPYSQNGINARPVPAAVLLPLEEASRWQLIMPHPKTGDAVVSDINAQAQKAIEEIIPRPTSTNSYKVKTGWRVRPKPSQFYLTPRS